MSLRTLVVSDAPDKNDGSTVDGPSDADAGRPTKCSPGAIVSPARAFLPDAGVDFGHPMCSVGAILAERCRRKRPRSAGDHPLDVQEHRRPMRVTSAFAFAFVVSLVVACENKIIKTETPATAEEGLPEGDRESEACTKAGTPTNGVNAFDVTPGTEAEGLVCDLGNVLDEDDNLTGLARPGAAKGTLRGKEVNGCVGVKFGDGNTISSLIMRMRPLSGMCGHSCTEGGSDGCGTGWKVQIFVGPSFEKLEWLQQLSLTTPDLFEYRVAVHRSYAAQYAVVCREATPETGDDIGIDVISGLCDDPPKQ